MPSILLVTASFPPSRLIGGRRALRMALGLRDHGWQVTVLTLHPPYMTPLDPKPADLPGIEVVATHALMPRAWLQRQPPAQAAGPASAPSVARQPSALVSLGKRAGRWLQRVEFPDAYVGWLPFALTALGRRRFDVVLATLPPPTNALIGAALAARMSARLVLDYRDPWTEVLSVDGSYGVDRAVPEAEIALNRALEARMLASARLVLAVTPRMTRWLSARTQTPVEFLPNGLDELPPAEPPARDQPLRLVYAGSLAYARSLEPVLAAIARVHDRLGPDALRLTYAGPHGAQLRQAAEQAGVAAWLDDRGELPAAAARALYRGAVAGIVSVSRRTDYSYPGKLFEVLGAGCPIWLCGPEDCDAADFVRDHGLGEVDSGADPATSAAILERLLQAPPRAISGLDDWLAPAQVARLDARLRALLA